MAKGQSALTVDVDTDRRLAAPSGVRQWKRIDCCAGERPRDEARRRRRSAGRWR